MKIEITNCEWPTFWYKNRIGKIYTVISVDKREKHFEVKTRHKDDGKYYINFTDCKVLK